MDVTLTACGKARPFAIGQVNTGGTNNSSHGRVFFANADHVINSVDSIGLRN